MTRERPDREVVARRADGAEVIRYDVASRWYLEPSGDCTAKRTHLNMAQAVAVTVDIALHGGRVCSWHTGHGRFGSAYRKALAEARTAAASVPAGV